MGYHRVEPDAKGPSRFVKYILDTHVVSTHNHLFFLTSLLSSQNSEAFRQRSRFKHTRAFGPPLRLLVESVLSRWVTVRVPADVRGDKPG